ncbi:hypothetical protein EDWATA_03837 [Edwardsiella tarda ATCC 23685]|uniref:Uncharacterized protein n=1 Tax=Edwardsiella tarda ATCC 23685 TaxID=500638 RepID=D4FAL6_EDWTA|nr:hypothetical protein EDWATA_03837 [Edwardsiella tarda ATCC 23685]
MPDRSISSEKKHGFGHAFCYWDGENKGKNTADERDFTHDGRFSRQTAKVMQKEG